MQSQTATQPAIAQPMLPLDMMDDAVVLSELRRHLDMAKRGAREHSLACLPITWAVFERLLDRLNP